MTFEILWFNQTPVTPLCGYYNPTFYGKEKHKMKELNFNIIGSRIRERRNSLGRTQDYLANYLDVDASHISNIEHGRSKVSLTALVGISNALDCSIDYFLYAEYEDSAIPADNEIMKKLSTCNSETKEKISGIIDILNSKS